MRHLKRRGNTFHYRRAVPADVRPFIEGQPTEWTATLATSSQREAEAKARVLGSEHDDLIRQARKLPPIRRHAEAAQRASGALRQAAMDRYIAELKSASADGVGRAMELLVLGDTLAAVRAKLDILRGETIAEVTRHHAVEYEALAKVPLTSTDVSAVLDLYTAGDVRRMTVETSTYLRELEAKEKEVGREAYNLGLAEKKEVPEDPNNPRVLIALENWLTSRKQKPDTSRKHRVYIRRFAEHVNNAQVRSLKKKDVITFIEDFVPRIPNSDHLGERTRAGRVADLITARETWLEDNPDAEPDDWPLISPPTVSKHLESVKALLGWVASREEDFTNIARDVKAPKDDRPRDEYDIRPFAPDEARRIFNAAQELWGDNSDMLWLLRAAALTGARLEELAQLACDNIATIDAVPCIIINDNYFEESGKRLRRQLKNDMSRRQIPLHPWLIENGFVDYAKKGKTVRVFSSFGRASGRYGQAASQAFHRLLRDTLNITDRRVRFHSFRHGFITALHNAGVSQAQVNTLAGHTRAKGAAGGYIGDLSLPILAKAVSSVAVPW